LKDEATPLGERNELLHDIKFRHVSLVGAKDKRSKSTAGVRRSPKFRGKGADGATETEHVRKERAAGI
jgi:hypothetical protein